MEHWIIGEQLINEKDVTRASYDLGEKLEPILADWFITRAIITVDEFLFRLTGGLIND